MFVSLRAKHAQTRGLLGALPMFLMCFCKSDKTIGRVISLGVAYPSHPIFAIKVITPPAPRVGQTLSQYSCAISMVPYCSRGQFIKAVALEHELAGAKVQGEHFIARIFDGDEVRISDLPPTHRPDFGSKRCRWSIIAGRARPRCSTQDT